MTQYFTHTAWQYDAKFECSYIELARLFWSFEWCFVFFYTCFVLKYIHSFISAVLTYALNIEYNSQHVAYIVWCSVFP